MASKAKTFPRFWWGKIIGALLGLSRGSLTAGLLGLLLGHILDRVLQQVRAGGMARDLFFESLFGALGYLAKADGRVSEQEIATAERLMRRFGLEGEERQAAISQFNAGKEPGFDLEGSLRGFARYALLRPDLRQACMEVLLECAAADGAIGAAERAVLVRAAQALHIPRQVLEAMLYAASGGAGFRGHNGWQTGGAPRSPTSGPSLAADYATLGLTASASEAEIKRAYRKLISQYHPDRLATRGLPEGVLTKARDRVSEINAAYDRLKQARGIK